MKLKKEKLFVEKERVGSVIGKRGRTKKILEEELDIKLKISKSGEITIQGKTLERYAAIRVLQAISFGFSPDEALQLKNTDYTFEVIHIKDFAKTKHRLREIRARLIGKRGRVRKTLQDLGNISLHISNKKIGIIGKTEDVFVAKDAIKSLIRGAKHARIFKWLENKKRY